MPLNWAISAVRARAIRKRVEAAPWRDAKNLPVIYVPGILGVKLHDRTQRADIWGDARGILRPKPGHKGFALDDSNDVVATETLHHFRIATNLVTTLVTAELVDTLEGALGYREGHDLIFLNHDWRRDYRLVAERLELEIRRIQLDFGKRQRVVIIGQSVANLAIRMMLRTCSPQIRASIAKWYAFGPPWQGTFNALKMLREGYYPASRRFKGFSPADAATFAPCYQLLPRNAQLLDASGAAVPGFDLYNAECWIEYGLGDPALATAGLEARRALQARLDDARQFGEVVAGTDPAERAIAQTWFAGARNHAVRAAIAEPDGALVTEDAIRARHPALADRALARGDDHIPLDHLTADPCGPLIRSYDAMPYGESYVAIGMAKDHRALINYPQNLTTLAMDLAALRARE
jgi:hypothetical protein